ncbi:hypothetical protein OYC64_015152 [Pagothenia borchgrevinki]|uniref:Uncharacterized protein n=1 Tax=Pagothenia borchgrevinki TaxID=8213 RepID=A0ABD2H375_PAGBO
MPSRVPRPPPLYVMLSLADCEPLLLHSITPHMSQQHHPSHVPTASPLTCPNSITPHMSQQHHPSHVPTASPLTCPNSITPHMSQQHHPSHVPTASPLTCPNSTSLQRNVQDLKINSTFNRLYIQVGCREPAEVKPDTRNAPSAKHWNMNKKIRTAHLDTWSAVTCPKIVSLQRSVL